MTGSDFVSYWLNNSHANGDGLSLRLNDFECKMIAGAFDKEVADIKRDLNAMHRAASIFETARAEIFNKHRHI